MMTVMIIIMVVVLVLLKMKMMMMMFIIIIIITTTIIIIAELSLRINRLVGLVVKASASRAEGPGFESRLSRDFFGVESYQ